MWVPPMADERSLNNPQSSDRFVSPHTGAAGGAPRANDAPLADQAAQPAADPASRLVSGDVQSDDRGSEKTVDYALRPRSLHEMIGQERLRGKMQILVDAARQRGDTLDHVLLYGPPGLGKCITADSLILTENGLLPFRTLLPADLAAGEYRQTATQVVGLHGLEPASHVYASGRTVTLRLRTHSGFAIEGTLDHPLLVATVAGPVWRPLRDIQPGDAVAIARGAEQWGAASTVHYRPAGATARRQATETRVTELHTTLGAALQRPPTLTELRHAYAGHVAGNPVPEITAKRLALPLSNGRAVAQVAAPWTLVASPTAAPGRTICLDADVGYLLGAIVGDGHFERSTRSIVITADEPAMQCELQQICAALYGAAPAIKQYGGKAARLRLSSHMGQALLDFGMQPATAAGKSVPAAVLVGPRAAAVGFLQGLFDADGCAWSDGSVEFGTRSLELSRQVQLLLANLGIIAHRTSKQRAGAPFYNLFLGGEQAARFFATVGFRLPRKQQRQVGLTTRPRGWARSELVPGANPLLVELLDATKPHSRAIHKRFDHARRNDRTPTRAQVERLLALLPAAAAELPAAATLRTLLNPAIYWDQVVALDPAEAETFDFVVPGSHSFVANGFYNHNTTLSHILAYEMGANLKVTAGPAIEKAGDLAAILTNLRRGDILFIDEIHRLGRAVEEILYPAMEDFALDIVVGSGPGARNIRLSLPKFSVVGATTRLALLTSPLRARFGVVERFDFYETHALQEIVRRAAAKLEMPIEDEGALEVARRSRGTPRVSLRLLRRVRDYAQVRADGQITLAVAQAALTLLDIDWLGLDELDRRVLEAIIVKFNGGPVGLDTLAASISEEADTIMDVVEPYLLQMGFLDRTPRGRVATRAAYTHMGIPFPDRAEQGGLFG